MPDPKEDWTEHLTEEELLVLTTLVPHGGPCEGHCTACGAPPKEFTGSLLHTVATLRALVEELQEAGFPIARGFPNFCNVDRKGICHSHGKAKPCPVSLFRAALALTEDEMWKRLEEEKP